MNAAFSSPAAELTSTDLVLVAGGAMPSEFLHLSAHQRMLLWFASTDGQVTVLVDGVPTVVRV